MFEVPFADVAGQDPVPVIEVMINGAGPFVALIDTGNATPFTALVSRTVASKANLVQSGFEQATLMVRQGESRQTSLAQTLNNRITIQGTTWEDARFGILPGRDHLSVLPGGAVVDVVLGAAFLSDRVVAIDFTRRIIDLDAKPGQANGISFTLNYRQPLLIVDARINNSDGMPMIIDTGSLRTTVWTPVAESAKLPTSMPTALLNNDGASGQLMAIAHRFELAGQTRCNQLVAVSDTVGDLGVATRQIVMGQIGSDVLGYGRLTIDYPNQRLWYRQQGPAQKCGPVSSITNANMPAPEANDAVPAS